MIWVVTNGGSSNGRNEGSGGSSGGNGPDIGDGGSPAVGGVVLQKTPREGANDILLPNGLPPCALRSPAPRERHLSMPEIGEKERNYLFRELYRLRVMT